MSTSFFFLSRKLLHSCNSQEKKWLCSAFLHTFPQPVTTSAHAHLQAASNKLGSTSVESSWLQFSDFSSLTAKSCLVRMEIYNILNKFFKIHHTQYIENYTTIEQYLQLESFREIPPKPLAWTLGDSPQQKYRLQQLQTPENYNFYFCSVLWASASFNSWKFTQMCLGTSSNAFYTFTTEGRINSTATDFGNSAHGHVLSNVFLLEKDFPIFISLNLTGNLQYTALLTSFLSPFIRKWRC